MARTPSPPGSWPDAQQDVERPDQVSVNSNGSKESKGKKADRIPLLPPEILEQ